MVTSTTRTAITTRLSDKPTRPLPPASEAAPPDWPRRLRLPVLKEPQLTDIVVLTKNQLVMSYKIALASGKSGSPRHMIGEVLGVVGGAFLFRQGARQLIGLIPLAGIAPKVVVAYAGTQAIGRAVAVWAAEGRKLSRSTVQRLYREARGRGRHVADSLVAQAQRARGRSASRDETEAE